MPERTPEEIAQEALRLADGVAEGHLDRLRQEARQSALTLILGDRQYRVGAEIARRMDFTEEKIHDLISEVTEIHLDDEYMAWEDAFGLDMKLLD